MSARLAAVVGWLVYHRSFCPVAGLPFVPAAQVGSTIGAPSVVVTSGVVHLCASTMSGRAQLCSTYTLAAGFAFALAVMKRRVLQLPADKPAATHAAWLPNSS